MIKGLLPMIYTGAGVAAAGTTGYVVMNPEIFTGANEEIAGLVDPAAIKVAPQSEEVAALPQTQTEEAVPAPTPPAFTLLRVEKDGSLVVAGTGPNGSAVTLLNGGEKLAETKAESQGDFAFVLDKPLAPGLHELHLIAVTSGGIEVASIEAGIINIPEPDTAEEPTVLVSAVGEATKILQKPEQVEAEPKEEVVAKVPEVEEPVAEPAVAPQIHIEAADIESGRIYIAGKGEAGSKINLYFVNELLGQTTAGSNGAFLFEREYDIEAGRHAVRADMLDAESGQVIARAEVELVHNPEVVVAVTEEPKQAEPAKRKVIRTGSAVIIRRGDNLWRVARRSYGEGVRYTTIFEANKDQVRNPDLIYPGQVLKLPDSAPNNDSTNSG